MSEVFFAFVSAFAFVLLSRLDSTWKWNWEGEDYTNKVMFSNSVCIVLLIVLFLSNSMEYSSKKAMNARKGYSRLGGDLK